MKSSLVICLFFIFSHFLIAQVEHSISIDPTKAIDDFPSSLKPGIFYHQFWIPYQNNVLEFVSSEGMYNTFRDNKFNSECWKWSSSHQDVLERMDENNLKSWLEWQQNYAEKIVVKFNGMPYWLSSSDDWSVLYDESWRAFMTYPPSDYAAWNETIIAVVNKIKGWGLHPYYEIWNEPDGMYWQGSDAELLELYKQTALSIKAADPQAKVGGFGMHTWWRSADPEKATEQDKYKSPVMGFLPDSIPEKYALLYKLMDSAANSWMPEEVPLDFVSFHFFNWNSYDLVHSARQMRDKMDALGYCPPGEGCDLTNPAIYVSEWQTTYHIQEQLFQPGLFIKIMKQLEMADIQMNSIAAINDFGSSESDEFTNDWGLFSQNALIKPVFKAVLNLSEVTNSGKSVPNISNPEIDVFASLSHDTLRILVSNYSMPVWWYHNYYRFAWSCFERLLYDSTSVYNAMDFVSHGMTSIYWGNSNNEYGSVDSIIRGQLKPPGHLPEGMIRALDLARTQHVFDSTSNVEMHRFSFSLEVENDSLKIFYSAIDSTRNNIIYLYDSLKQHQAYTHQQAVDSLQACTFPGGCFGVFSDYDSISVSGKDFDLMVRPNTVLYLAIPGIQLQSVGLPPTITEADEIKIFPNPVQTGSKVRFTHDRPGYIGYSIYDLLGRLVKVGDPLFLKQGLQNLPLSGLVDLPGGTYLLEINCSSKRQFVRFVVN